MVSCILLPPCFQQRMMMILEVGRAFAQGTSNYPAWGRDVNTYVWIVTPQPVLQQLVRSRRHN